MVDNKSTKPLSGQTVLITGAAKRIGKTLALACATAGADIIIHHGHSPVEAEEVRLEVEALGQKAWVLQCDLNDPEQAAAIVSSSFNLSPIDAVINNAALFQPGGPLETSLETWQEHLNTNLTAPFLISQAFARCLPPDQPGRIINLLDWRALRPGVDHFAYTISKAALAAMTQSMAAAFAPHITVNGLALGAILPPADDSSSNNILRQVPANRWASLEEVGQAVLFLLSGPAYITGEIIHLDGGRHLI